MLYILYYICGYNLTIMTNEQLIISQSHKIFELEAEITELNRLLLEVRTENYNLHNKVFDQSNEIAKLKQII